MIPDPKPCPFCGSGDIVMEENTNHPGWWVLVCQGCKAQRAEEASQTFALFAWNQRVEVAA